jgi:hypothetical protein
MRNVSFLRGERKGIDHAQYIIDVDELPEPPLEGFAMPLGPMTLTKYMEWHWRIKTLRLTGSYTTNPGGTPTVFTFNSVDIPNTYFTGALPNTTVSLEQQKVGADFFIKGTSPVALIPLTGTWSPTVLSTAFSLYLQTMPNNADLYYTASSQFWMNFYFKLIVPSAVGSAGPVAFQSSKRNAPQTGIINANFACTVSTLTVDGMTIPMWRTINSAENANQHLTIVITPVEWWPYKTKSGAAVYDTATGAQLNDPFS